MLSNKMMHYLIRFEHTKLSGNVDKNLDVISEQTSVKTVKTSQKGNSCHHQMQQSLEKLSIWLIKLMIDLSLKLDQSSVEP